MRILLSLFLLPLQLFAQPFSKTEIGNWEKQAKQVTIIRDNYGVPHIYGKTDADAVFGLMYAQCEDDFKRVEMNYIEKLGRLAEVNGEKNILIGYDFCLHKTYSSLLPFSPTNQCSLFLNSTLKVVSEP